MSVCLTKKQAEFFKIISKYRDENGYYPSLTQAARLSGKKPGSVVAFYGSLFMRGVFSDGKPQTRFHAESHVRTERRVQAQRVAARRPAAPAQPQQTNAAQKRRIAQALVKLLSGEVDSTDAISQIASLMR